MTVENTEKHSFDLHRPVGANKKRRIVGRGQGSGYGTTAGKGNKGQQSRSGGKTYLGFEGGQMPLYRRLAHRGFSNYYFKKENQIVSLAQLEKNFSDGAVVDIPSLFEKGLINGSNSIKILGNGELSKKLDVKIEKISTSARAKITTGGGTVPEIKTDAPKTKRAKGKKTARDVEIARSSVSKPDVAKETDGKGNEV